jgi:hypothetical protein
MKNTKNDNQKINLVLIKGRQTFNIDGDYEKLMRFEISDLSPSSEDFLEGVKSLANLYAYEFFDVDDFDKSEKMLKAKTLKEVEEIIKEELYSKYSEDEGEKQTYSISIIEIKNESIIEGLKHLPENFFSGDYEIKKKISELKKDEKFKEALELTDSFNKLEESVKLNCQLLSKTELERIERELKYFNEPPDFLKKEYEDILKKYYS